MSEWNLRHGLTFSQCVWTKGTWCSPAISRFSLKQVINSPLFSEKKKKIQNSKPEISLPFMCWIWENSTTFFLPTENLHKSHAWLQDRLLGIILPLPQSSRPSWSLYSCMLMQTAAPCCIPIASVVGTIVVPLLEPHYLVLECLSLVLSAFYFIWFIPSCVLISQLKWKLKALCKPDF